ncbi:hypothetical protein MKW92_016733 [Papaver armeniacum]|nr:hypothetical protein MKW92_016733 [Papaver armeniacum]
MANCSIRAIWILNNQDTVVFSRYENENSNGDNNQISPSLPNDSEFTTAFIEKRREGSSRGFGFRVVQSSEGSDSWVDDPITRHIIGLHIDKEEEEGEKYFLWPLVLHIRNPYCILILPLVEPRHLKSYERMCNRSDCGSCIGEEESLPSLLLDLPCITGSFMVAHTIGDVIIGDSLEPEVLASVAPSVGGLLDSLTGTAPVAVPNSSGGVSGAATSDASKISSRLADRDALCTFISSALPFGTPLDLNYSNISAVRVNGFSSTDTPPVDMKQPAWKPYLYRGKQRILFTIHETVYASMYDRDDIPDSISVSGQVNCRAELEGLPDVSLPLNGLSTSHLEVLSFHPCAQISEHGVDKQAMMFSPPVGNFVLIRYQGFCGIGPPVKGFYQLSMVSEDEGYKSPITMEYCTLTMPFPRRKIISFDGNPSIGTISTTEHSVEWKIVTIGRGISGKSIEATFPGTIKFAPKTIQKLSTLSRPAHGLITEDDDDESENINNIANIEDFLLEKMNKDLPPVDLEEPFCWQSYNYARVSFKISGATMSGMLIDPKSVTVYPTVKAPVEFTTQVSSGDYILWNTLGKCPFVAAAPRELQQQQK